MTLDFATLLVLSALANGLIAGVTLVGTRQGVREDGASLMALGMVLMAGGLLVFGLREVLAQWLAYTLGNVLLAASALAYVAALQRLYAMTTRWTLRIAAAALVLMLLWNAGHFAVAGNSYLRSGVSGVLLGVAYLLPGLAVARRFAGWYGLMHYVIAAAFFAGGVLQIAHGAWELQAGAEAYRAQFSANPVTRVLGPSLLSIVIVGSFGFLLMLRERDLLRLAMLDGLTGAMNRRAMLEQMRGALAFARRTGLAFSVVLADLDHFKRINDVHGHAAGDEVLRHFTALVRGLLRSGDVLGRYGGEEFALLLPGTPAQGAIVLGQRLREALVLHPPSLPSGELPYTASLGIVEWRPGSEADIEALLAQADQALYAAKRDGRDRARVYAGAGQACATPLAVPAPTAR